MASNIFSNDDWSLYPYDPIKPLPIIFAVLLTIIGLIQIYQSFFKYHWKKFGSMFTWATSVWISGFVCRSISVYSVRSPNIFIAQFVLILMGPPLYAAAEYFILGRLMAYLPYHAPLHPGRVLSTFLLLSVLVESFTANGAAQSSGSNKTPGQLKAGHAFVEAGLLLQCCVEVLFFSMVLTMEWRCHRAKIFPKNVRWICRILYITSSMMLLRCIIRSIEGFEASSCPQPSDGLPHYCGVVSTHEAFLWIFEVTNITLFVIILAVFPPGRFLPRSSRVFLDQFDGKTERLGPGFAKADKRPLLVTVVDPFNLHGIITGKGHHNTKFWDEHQPIFTGQEIGKAKSVRTSEEPILPDIVRADESK